MTSILHKNRLELILIIILLAAAAFLRFYHLPEYMTFLGDEGRDALMVQRILVDHDFPLLGPPTSVGNIYLGPLYYYMMAFSMAIFWLNPVAAAAMVALIGVAAVALIYYLSLKWFGRLPAILAAALYALSPVAITYSRSSWNPNPAPFFALLVILGFYQAHTSRDFRWLILVGGAFAFALQMHYLSLILLPLLGVLWIIEVIEARKKKGAKFLVLGTTLGSVLFLLLMSPLIIFDLKYNFMNFQALRVMFSVQDSALGIQFGDNLSKIILIYKDKLIGRYLAIENSFLSISLALLIVLSALSWIGKKASSDNTAWAFRSLALWLFIGLIGLSFYKNEIYDHYLGFLNPAPFLLIGGLIKLVSKKWLLAVLAFFLIVVGALNIQKNPLFTAPNKQLERTQEVAKLVIREAKGKPFNFALIARNNYDAAYQFYLEQYGFKPKVVPLEITDQLFVVCEDEVCNPVGHPKYEIAGFGWTKIEKEDSLLGVKVFKLVHNPDQFKNE